MMVQTGMALSHGQGTKHHSPTHYLSSNYNVLSCPLGPQKPTICPPSLRQMLRLQRRFHPKSQYRCHWLKQRMKRKTRKMFRKPSPKYKAVTFTLCALLTAYKVGSRVERFFFSSSLSGGFCWVSSLFSNTSTQSISFDPTPCQGSLKARFVAFQSRSSSQMLPRLASILTPSR
jgi:hypothetical protein